MNAKHQGGNPIHPRRKHIVERDVVNAWEQDLFSIQEISKLHKIPLGKVRQLLSGTTTISPEEHKLQRERKQLHQWQMVGADFRKVAKELSETQGKRVDFITTLTRQFPHLSPETVELFFDRSIEFVGSKPNPPTKDRDMEIVSVWESELVTLDSLGRRFGLTRERVRQILKENGAKSKAEVATSVRAELELRFASNRDVLIDELKGLSADKPVSKAEATKILAEKFPGFPEEMVRELVSSSQIPLPSKRTTSRDVFSSVQLELAVLMCFGLCYPRALEGNDFAHFIDASHEAELRRFSNSDSFPSNIEFSRILNAIGFTSLKRKEKVLDSFAHGDYEQKRVEIWSENGWKSGHGGRYWPPTQQTISKRIGNGYWNDAMQKIGFPVSSKRGRPRVGYLHNEESLVQTLRQFLLHCMEDKGTTGPSVRAYDLWRYQENDRGAKHASVATIRSYFGSWNRAVYTARIHITDLANVADQSSQVSVKPTLEI